MCIIGAKFTEVEAKISIPKLVERRDSFSETPRVAVARNVAPSKRNRRPLSQRRGDPAELSHEVPPSHEGQEA